MTVRSCGCTVLWLFGMAARAAVDGTGGTGDRLAEKKRMKLVKLHSVEAAIRTLSQQERQRVFAWFIHLANWENDPHTREMSKPSVDNDVYVLNTSDDIRIFFKLDLEKKEITVLDIAKPSRFATAGRASE